MTDKIYFTRQEWNLLKGCLENYSRLHSNEFSEFVATVENRLTFSDRCLTPEEDEVVFDVRTILQDWGIAADEIPDRILMNESYNSIRHELGNGYTLFVYSSDMETFRYRFIYIKFWMTIIAEIHVKREGIKTYIRDSNFMPALWKEKNGKNLGNSATT